MKFWINANDACSDSEPICVQKYDSSGSGAGFDSDETIGSVVSKDIQIKPGMQLLITDQTLPNGVQFDFEIENAPVELNYSFSGRTSYKIFKGRGHAWELSRQAGSCAVSILPNTHGTIQHEPCERTFDLTIFFSQAVFAELFQDWPEILRDIGAMSRTRGFDKFIIHEHPLDPRSSMILRQIINSPYQGSAASLFLEAKALELVAVKLDIMRGLSEGGAKSLSKKELELVRQAHHILLKNRQNPPSLDELCRMVGLNRNKLNNGFKSLFGDTVFGVLQHEKLGHAWSLLEQSDLPLVEIALEAGYKNQASFTTAFCNCFGCTPGSLRRSNSLS